MSEQAAAIPYASVDLTIGGQGGLLILAEKADGLTFWQSSKRETIVLRQGYVDSTRGLQRDLLMTQLSGPVIEATDRPWQDTLSTPVEYRVERSWRDADGRQHTRAAQATLACSSKTEQVELPLTTLALEKCREALVWDNGQETASVLWRHPRTKRIWAAEVVAWPGAPKIAWRVARPWW